MQKPHSPICVGGHSRAALRRTARHGDGWHPVGAGAASPLPPQEMRAHIDTLKQLTEAERRDFSALTISYKAPLYDNRHSLAGWLPTLLRQAGRHRGDIRNFAAIGAHELIFDCRGQSVAESIERSFKAGSGFLLGKAPGKRILQAAVHAHSRATRTEQRAWRTTRAALVPSR